MFLPVLIWNADAWLGVVRVPGRSRRGRPFLPAMPLVTLGGEALFLLPWIWLPLMVVFVQAIRRGPREWRGWLLCCLAALPILVFTLVSAWSSHRVLYHWAAPGYLMLFPLLGVLVARDLERGLRVTRIWLAGTAVFVLLGVAVVGTQVRYGWLPGFSSYFPPGKDPSLEAVDWTELRAALAARGLGRAARSRRRRGQLARHRKIGYALGGSETVICLNTDDRQFGLDRPAADRLGQGRAHRRARRGCRASRRQIRARLLRIETLPAGDDRARRRRGTAAVAAARPHAPRLAAAGAARHVLTCRHGQSQRGAAHAGAVAVDGPRIGVAQRPPKTCAASSVGSRA